MIHGSPRRLQRAAFGLFIAGASVLAFAQGADVGLVNLVSGDVRYVPASGSPGQVKPFMRVRDGDRFSVPAGGQVRIVFFAGARQERWTGPASLRAGSGAATPVSGGPPEVSALPTAVTQRIASVPDLMARARLGGVQVRAMPKLRPESGGDRTDSAVDPQARVREAREIYQRMRQEMPADDITAELYLYAVLSDLQLRDEIRAVVEEMARKQPENEEIRKLLVWVSRQSGR